MLPNAMRMRLGKCKVQINRARHEREEKDLSSAANEENTGIISKGVFFIKEGMRNLLGRLHIHILGIHCGKVRSYIYLVCTIKFYLKIKRKD